MAGVDEARFSAHIMRQPVARAKSMTRSTSLDIRGVVGEVEVRVPRAQAVLSTEFPPKRSQPAPSWEIIWRNCAFSAGKAVREPVSKLRPRKSEGMAMLDVA